MTSETVLVPINVGSETDRAALFAKLAEQAGRGATIVFMTVVPEIYLATDTDPKGTIEAMQEHAGVRLAEVAEAAPFKVDRQVVRYGPVAPAILDVAGEIGATLILINARQKGRAVAYALGSVASRVANHAQCSVMVLRH